MPRKRSVRKPAHKSLGAVLLEQWRGETSQVDASAMLGMDETIYSRFESGVRRPGGQWAARIDAITAGKVPATSWYQPVPKANQIEARAS